MGMFESALARPKNRAAYGEPDSAALAAAFAFARAMNHPFVDGNKRIALVALESFLALISVAAGSFSEEELTAWIRKNIEPL
jgi:death-on-curing protein